MNFWDTNAGTIVAGAGILVGLAYLMSNEIRDAAAEVGEKVNPTDPDNLAYSGVNAVGETLSGQEDWSLGAWLYEVSHPRRVRPEQRVQE